MNVKARKYNEKESKINNKVEKSFPIWVADFLEVRLISPTAKNDYFTKLNQYFNWLVDTKVVENKVEDLSIEDIDVKSVTLQRYLGYLKERGLKPSSIQSHIKTLSSFYNYLWKDGEIRKSPLNNINLKRFKVADQTVKELKLPETKQMKQLLKAIQQSKQNTELRRFLALRDLTIIQFFMGTGVRCEELVDLTLDDLHLEEDRPYVSVLGKGHYEEEEKRKVYLGYVNQDLKSQLENYLALREFFAKGNEYLFINAKGENLTTCLVNKTLEKYCEEFEWKITPHMIRHYYASHLAKKESLQFVKDQLGHSDINTTSSYYVSSIIK